MALDALRGNGLRLSFDLPITILVVAFAAALAWLLASVLTYRRSAQRFRNVELSPEEKRRRREDLRLTDVALKAGYSIREFQRGTEPSEYFVMSAKVNNHLTSEREIVAILEPVPYEIPEAVRPFVPGLLHRLASARTIVHNGKLIGLRTDITPESRSLTLQQSRYFEAQSSDEIIDRLLWDIHEVNPSMEGRALTVDDAGRLKSLSLTAATNHIGVSTLVVTDDDYVLFQRQGNGSNVNKGRWAPSGSGSVDLQDWRALEREARRNQVTPTLAMLLTRAAEREFKEEFGIDGVRIPPLRTKIVGFARLIERGGKPDFFAVTRIPLPLHDLLEIASRRRNVKFRERGLSTKSKHPVRISRGLGKAVASFLSDEPGQSIQNHIFGEILKGKLRNVERHKDLQSD